jgi:hypothetical protein
LKPKVNTIAAIKAVEETYKPVAIRNEEYGAPRQKPSLYAQAVEDGVSGLAWQL